MRIDADTPLWVVTDATRQSNLGDVCIRTTLDGLWLQFVGGLTMEMEQHPVLFTTEEEAHEEAKNRLLVWKVARKIRLERGRPAGEVVKVVLHGEDGRVLWQGEVR